MSSLTVSIVNNDLSSSTPPPSPTYPDNKPSTPSPSESVRRLPFNKSTDSLRLDIPQIPNLDHEHSPADPQLKTPGTPASAKRPKYHQRRISYVKNLEINIEKDRQRFGLSEIQVCTNSPITATCKIGDSEKMDGESGLLASASSSKTQPQNVPLSRRQPPPPSPLSKMSSPADQPTHHEPPSPGVTLSPPAMNHSGPEIVTSPCYIHSYLDQHGKASLTDYLNFKSPNSPQTSRRSHTISAGMTSAGTSGGGGGAGVGTPSTARQIHQHQVHQSPRHQAHVPHHHHPSHVQSHQSDQPLHRKDQYSPYQSRNNQQQQQQQQQQPQQRNVKSPSSAGNSMSGYDSDRSSINGFGGSAMFDGEYDEDGGSLTRHLAETAQGVREMSRELGRTRVRSRIQSVLVVTKARDNRLIRLTRELAIYLMSKKVSIPPSDSSRSQSSTFSQSSQNAPSDRGMIVYVDRQLKHSKRFDAEGIKKDHPEFFEPLLKRRTSSSSALSSAYPSAMSVLDDGTNGNGSGSGKKDEGQLRYWTSEMCSSEPHLFDFVITLGGDGTVLFTSWLFQKIVPPVLPFALGSLGFLTNFNFPNYAATMDKVIDDGIRVNLRMRFTCTVYRAIAPEEASKVDIGGRRRKAIKRPDGEILIKQVGNEGWDAVEAPSGAPPCVVKSGTPGKDKEIMCFSTRPVEQFEVLNDLVVDRGPSPYVSLLELFGDEHHLTTVQADGLTVSTPTGSTAYSLSAGGSLVHPQIPALLLTPICPHTLSFRPMLLPDSMELRICVPYNSRSTAWASFDGRGRVELKQGDHIKVTASKYPFPTVCADKASTDWFTSVSRTLRWNEREKQKSFVVVEEDHQVDHQRREDETVRQRDKERAEKGNEVKNNVHFDDHEDEEEEEETYDIDDDSAGDLTPQSPQSPSDPPPSDLKAKNLKRVSSSHKSGVDSPDRFATPYNAPPPLSQRHLVERLAAAELKEKENEQGQRDEIRGDPSLMRLRNGSHAIPTQLERRKSDRQMQSQKSPRGGGLPRRSTDHKDIQEETSYRDGEDRNDIEGLPGGLQDGVAPELDGIANGRTHAHPTVENDKEERTPRGSQSHREHHHRRHQHHDPSAHQHQNTGNKGKAECKAKAFAFFGQDDSNSDMSDDSRE